MRMSYNWLKEFVDIKATPEQLAEDLNSFGHEVEEVKKVGPCPEEHREQSSKVRRRDDYILDLSITANRGDCLSVLGMAREIAALYNLKLKTTRLDSQKARLENENLNLKSSILNHKLKITISDPNIYSRYSVRIIDNIKIGESPKWIQDRLKLVGFRPINNIVDVTNYVMLKTGQPLHAFDYNKIHDGKMNIRLAKNGESVVTLDGKNRQLDDNSIIIKDDKKIFDLAGIMGGANSEVDKNTKTIVLQAAIFDKKLIRATSKKLNHVTDASYRYERGVDINGTTPALEIASHFILKDCPSGKSGEIIDIKSKDNKDYSIQIDVNKINNLLGTNLSMKQIVEYLSRLNILTDQPIDKLTNQLIFNIPSYRQYDLAIWQDLAEEVARIHGYNNLGKNLPLKTQCQINLDFSKKQYIKDTLVNNCFTEIYSYSFADEKLMKMLGDKIDNSRVVINSVAPELKHLRMNLVPSILTAISKNPWAPEIKIFEIGRVFDSKGEKDQLIIAECNKNAYGIKQVLNELGINSEVIAPDQKVLDYLKIRRPVRYAIIDLDDKLLNKLTLPRRSASKSASISVRYKPVSQFPPTIRDLAFIVNKNVNSESIRSHISTFTQSEVEGLDLHTLPTGRQAGQAGSHILLVELFDEFVSDKFGKDMKNVAYHIWLQDLDKPMDSKEVDKIIKKIINNIEIKFNTKLRR